MTKGSKFILNFYFLLFISPVLCVINIDGGWSPWSKVETPCFKTEDSSETVLCGGGVRMKYRSCTNPMKQGTGQDCVGTNQTWFPCNTHPCQLPGEFLWSPWSECSVSCGKGIRKRFAMCGTIRKKSDGANKVSDTSDWTKSNYELEYEETCTFNQKNETSEPCNTWDRDHCEGPCVKAKCQLFSKCYDTSDENNPSYECRCQLGMITSDDGSTCIHPPPTTPTPRPDPTLPPEQKKAANIMTRSVSTILIIFLGITLGLFIILGIFDSSRIIHMNMEIALILAHICLIPTVHGKEDMQDICRLLSIGVNFFYMACFMFMFLESIHLYSLVAWVVHKDGLFTKGQNSLIGWGFAFVILLFDLCFEFDHFGGDYHCFLRLDTGLLYGIFIPMILLVIVTFAIVEAAGASDSYVKLEGSDEAQRMTARIMQRTLLFILPLVFASYILGALAEFEQNIYLYSIFTLVNGVLGGTIFFFHCSANERVRSILGRFRKKLCPGKDK